MRRERLPVTRLTLKDMVNYDEDEEPVEGGLGATYWVLTAVGLLFGGALTLIFLFDWLGTT